MTLEPDQILFVQLREEGRTRVLRPAVIHAASGDDLRVECSEEIEVGCGDAVVLYYEVRRNFVKQPAEVGGLRDEGAVRMCALRLIGEPVSAEKRTALRVSTVGMDLRAEFAAEPRCKVLDVSELGFSLYASVSREAGTVVDVSLHHDGHAIPGTVLVQSVRAVCGDRVRYGVRCVDGALKFALAGVNLKVQREQIRRERRRWS